jgi:hypothetical protein
MKSPQLFYKKYLYKLQLYNQLNTIFRAELQKSKNLLYARDKLDEYASRYRNGEPLIQTFFRTEREVPMEHYIDAKNLYLILKNEFGNYKVRVETGTNFTIYTNDTALLDNIVDRVEHTVQGVWRPCTRTKHLLKHDSIIVDHKPEFPIRVLLKDERIPKDFANWLRANRDKSRIGDTALQSIDNHHYLGGFYFHVRDEKVLSIVHMLIGHAVRGIYNLVYMPPVIDK